MDWEVVQAKWGEENPLATTGGNPSEGVVGGQTKEKTMKMESNQYIQEGSWKECVVFYKDEKEVAVLKVIAWNSGYSQDGVAGS